MKCKLPTKIENALGVKIYLTEGLRFKENTQEEIKKLKGSYDIVCEYISDEE